MNLELLDRDALKALTDRKTAAGVIGWLKQRAWVFEVGATGWPKVSTEYARMRLGGGKAEPTELEPNWSALRTAA